MLNGIGVDLVSIKRIRKIMDRHGEKFLNRIMSEKELEHLRPRKLSPASIAARFAAKEAVLKAIGCGIGPAALKEVEITGTSGEAPVVNLYGFAARYATGKSIEQISLSMTHEPPFACAIAAATGSKAKGQV